MSSVVRELGYARTSNQDFAATVANVVAQAEAHGFKVQHVHDVAATLNSKGFPHAPLQIVEICNAKFASQALAADVTVSLFMPCKINVYEREGQIVVNALRPALMAEFFSDPALAAVAAEVDAAVRKIVDAAVQ